MDAFTRNKKNCNHTSLRSITKTGIPVKIQFERLTVRLNLKKTSHRAQLKYSDCFEMITITDYE